MAEADEALAFTRQGRKSKTTSSVNFDRAVTAATEAQTGPHDVPARGSSPQLARRGAIRSDIGFMGAEAVDSLLQPWKMNHGHLAQTFDDFEAELLGVKQLEVRFKDEKGQEVAELMWVDEKLEAEFSSEPRVCVRVGSIMTMQRAISGLTRKVDSLVETLSTCRERYYRELISLHLRRFQSQAEHEAYWFKPATFKDPGLMDLVPGLRKAKDPDEASSFLAKVDSYMSVMPIDRLLKVCGIQEEDRKQELFQSVAKLKARGGATEAERLTTALDEVEALEEKVRFLENEVMTLLRSKSKERPEPGSHGSTGNTTEVPPRSFTREVPNDIDEAVAAAVAATKGEAAANIQMLAEADAKVEDLARRLRSSQKENQQLREQVVEAKLELSGRLAEVEDFRRQASQVSQNSDAEEVGKKPMHSMTNNEAEDERQAEDAPRRAVVPPSGRPVSGKERRNSLEPQEFDWNRLKQELLATQEAIGNETQPRQEALEDRPRGNSSVLQRLNSSVASALQRMNSSLSAVQETQTSAGWTPDSIPADQLLDILMCCISIFRSHQPQLLNEDLVTEFLEGLDIEAAAFRSSILESTLSRPGTANRKGSRKTTRKGSVSPSDDAEFGEIDDDDDAPASLARRTGSVPDKRRVSRQGSVSSVSDAEDKGLRGWEPEASDNITAEDLGFHRLPAGTEAWNAFMRPNSAASAPHGRSASASLSDQQDIDIKSAALRFRRELAPRRPSTSASFARTSRSASIAENPTPHTPPLRIDSARATPSPTPPLASSWRPNTARGGFTSKTANQILSARGAAQRALPTLTTRSDLQVLDLTLAATAPVLRAHRRTVT